MLSVVDSAQVIPVAVLPELDISDVLKVALLIAAEKTTVNVAGNALTGSDWPEA